jgi:folate-binding protein YgfZ
VLASPADAAAAFARFGDRIGDDRYWRRLDIEAMRAHVTEATAEEFLPQMWGLADRGAISFTKGCYLGQEVVARAQHRGQVKRSLGRLRWQGELPSHGLVIREQNGNTSATVVSFVETGRNEGLALAIGTSAAWTTPLHADGITFAAA